LTGFITSIYAVHFIASEVSDCQYFFLTWRNAKNIIDYSAGIWRNAEGSGIKAMCDLQLFVSYSRPFNGDVSE